VLHSVDVRGGITLHLRSVRPMSLGSYQNVCTGTTPRAEAEYIQVDTSRCGGADKVSRLEHVDWCYLEKARAAEA
jgi:hypothetical protein